MIDLNLPFLPTDSAAITVTTTVWVGVLVAVFFNLRLGWTLSALVVPGYLVPLLIARPTTAVVIFVEAVITYLIARWISDVPKLAPYWSSVFGRDRFFLIVVVSVLVRATCDGWLLPYFGQMAVEVYGWNIDYRNNLQSFGLIVVALIANYFWKPGLFRGLLPISTCIGITYFLVAYVMVGLTNFNVGNFHLIYEDVSTSLMASPKAYIIIITTAYLASWINLRYAWDFNGILIPALLGLLWCEPSKIVVSIIEAMVIYAIGRQLLKLDYFKNKAIQGGRKLIFFFTICFIMRLVTSHLLPFFSAANVSDVFGLGYLLSTLLAIKAHDKNFAIRMVRSAVHVSMTGAVVGTIIGYAFVCGPEFQFGAADVPEIVRENSLRQKHGGNSVIELVRSGKVGIFEKRQAESYQPPSAAELAKFRKGLKKIKDLPANIGSGELENIANHFSAVNYQVQLTEEGDLFLHESSPVRGWGMYVVNLKERNGLCLEVPTPLKEWATVEAGVCLYKHFSSSALAIAGAPLDSSLNGASNVLKNKSTMFSVFHDAFGKDQIVQIRGLTRRALAISQPDAPENENSDEQKSQLWVRGKIPSSLNLPKLKSLMGGFEVYWNDRSTANVLRTSNRFAELILTRADRRRLIGRTIVTASDQHELLRTEIVRRSLHDWMSDYKARICLSGTNSYVAAKTEEMLYMDQEVLQPLIKLLISLPTEKEQFLLHHDSISEWLPGWLSEDVASRLVVIDSAAKVLGYQLSIVIDPVTNEDYIAIREVDSVAAKGWGTFVFRPGLPDNFGVEIPRPLFEHRAFEFGLNLFGRPRSSVLLVAGAHPRANLDGSSDISKASNRTNMFNLVRHVLLRQLKDRPFLMCQARAIQAPVESDIVIAGDQSQTDLDKLSVLKSELVSQLVDDQMTVEFVDGNENTAGYELGLLMQATAVQVSQNKEVVSLWLSPSLRTKFKNQSEQNSLASQFIACGIPTFEGSLFEFLKLDTDESDTQSNTNANRLPTELRDRLTDYIRNYDVLKLVAAVKDFAGWQFTRVVDTSSGQAFLAIQKDSTALPTILNLSGSVGKESESVEALDQEKLNRFVRSRALWLEVAAQ